MSSRTLPSVNILNGTAAYAIADVIGGKLTFTNFEDRTGKGGAVKTIVVGDRQQKNIPMTLILFDADLTSTITDKTGLQLAAADVSKIIGEIAVGTANYRNYGTVNRSDAFVGGQDIPYSQALYGVMLAGATIAWSAGTSLSVRLGVGE